MMVHTHAHCTLMQFVSSGAWQQEKSLAFQARQIQKESMIVVSIEGSMYSVFVNAEGSKKKADPVHKATPGC